MSEKLKQETQVLYHQVIENGFSQIEQVERLAMSMSLLGMSLDPLIPSLVQQTTDPQVQGLVLLWLLTKRDHLRFNGCWERWNHEAALNWVMFLKEAWELGGFHRMHQARSNPPHPAYLPLLDRLLEEIRHQLADALETSFRRIKLAEAAHLLLIEANQMPQLAHFCQQRGWPIVGGEIIEFSSAQINHDAPIDGMLMAKELVVQAMGYAARFQQIV